MNKIECNNNNNNNNRPRDRNSAHAECKSENDTGNTSGDWNHFKITHTIPAQHTGKARN